MKLNLLKQGSFLIIAAALLTGCVSNDQQPDWVNNPKRIYPDSEYLVAVGEGDTRHAAENAAAATLSRIFEARIESDERLSDSSHETLDSFERTVDFTADISILSAQTLYNIQYAEAWKDQLGRYHVVAYLNRRSTAEIYRDKIDEQTTRVNFLIASAANINNLLKKYATLRAANQHALQADLLLRQLKVIHPRSVPDMTPSYSLNKLRKALADTAKQIRVSIDVDGDEEKKMTATLEEFITGYGFVVGKPAVLKMEAEVFIDDTGEREQDLVFVRYELRLNIVDSEGDTVITVRNKGREAHKTMDQARIRSFRTLEDVIKASGAQRLDTYFDSLIDQMH